MKRILLPALLLSLSSATWAGSPSAPGAKVMILEPRDGATVTSPVTVKFGIENMDLVPTETDKPNSGHHHLLIDVPTLPVASLPIAKDDQHQHFGKAQTETSVILAPGKHTLQLMLGDKDHVPHEPAVVSQKISITVK